MMCPFKSSILAVPLFLCVHLFVIVLLLIVLVLLFFVVADVVDIVGVVISVNSFLYKV